MDNVNTTRDASPPVRRGHIDGEVAENPRQLSVRASAQQRNPVV
jgi:hypothetical protein